MISYFCQLSKLFFNGGVLINNTESNVCLNLSTIGTTPALVGRGEDSNIIEAWFINSSSEAIALALSNHLNRKNMLQAT